MKKKSLLALLLTVSMVASGVVGCGSSKKDTDGGSESQGGDSGKQVELSITTWDNSTSPQFQTIIDAYEEKNTNVKINVIDTAANEYNNSVAVSMSAAQGDPDLIWVKDAGDILGMSEKGQLLALDDLIKADGIDLGIYGGTAELLQCDGVSYSLPYRSDWYMLYYNKDLFDAANVEYPTNDMTWDEYYALAEKMTSGEGSAKIYGTHNHIWHSLVSNWGLQGGENQYISDDYSFLKPVYEKTLNMQKEGYIQSYANLKTTNIHFSSVFLNQHVAMMPMGSWLIGTIMKSQAAGETDFNWGVVKIPHSEGMEAGTVVGSATPLVISAYTDQKELAWDFVKFATSEEAANILAKEEILTAIQTEETMNTISSAEFFPEDENSVEALSFTSFSLDRPIHKHSTAVKLIMDEIHEMIMIEEMTIDEGIAELTRRVNELTAS